MLVLGLQGSPRKKGNTNFLLETFIMRPEIRVRARRLLMSPEKILFPARSISFVKKKDFVRLMMTSEMKYIPCYDRLKLWSSPLPFFSII